MSRTKKPLPEALGSFHPATQAWFQRVFDRPTQAQEAAWKSLSSGDSTLLVAPTGSGKTLAAFLSAVDRLLFHDDAKAVLYVSPLKALAVDIEKNLRAPLTGIALEAQAMNVNPRPLSIGIRTGDTSPKERLRLSKHGADVFITTPESLYLMLTTRAHQVLRRVGVVIIDEIHALVPTKRGAHLALSLERLQQLVEVPLQRIGLSATQRPLEEVARFLGGFENSPEGFKPRKVTIADGRWKKQLSLSVEVPVADMAAVNEPIPGVATGETDRRSNSLWTAIHPQLLAHIHANRTTLIFVNSRRLAERLAGALNELAQTTLVQAHHGSLAREQRAHIEEALKRGELKAIVATSSLELGIDMGSIDLVIQVEAPPSIASGLQRIGRGGHQIDAVSTGVVVPKFRGDLLPCAALIEAMHEGQVESIRYPRNPLDVLCQQLVAMTSMATQTVDALHETVRQAAPFYDLSRQAFDSCVDILIGRYASDDFAEFRPRLHLDSITQQLKARPGAQRVALLNAGTIPDRGLYGVFLVGAPKGQGRIGELDEEMVFESRPQDCFLLGASTWRIEEITFDRVLVSPAPGVPARMPFWRGENVARPLEFGQRIGALSRKLLGLSKPAALGVLKSTHGLNDNAATNLLTYLTEQHSHAQVPDDKNVVVEVGRDELGDFRIAVLSPLGGQILAPWSIALVALAKERFQVDIETVWSNEGFVIRAPESASFPDFGWILLEEHAVDALLLKQLSQTSLFAARFREAAARALILTRRRPGTRTPLWQQRKKASDLLAAASRFDSFPLILEAYRELLADVFDVQALKSTLRELAQGSMHFTVLTPDTPSPFASALLFGYAANYLYEADTPPAERRAQALSIDPSQLKDLLGELELRELLDVDSIATVEAELQCQEADYRSHDTESLFDLLLKLGDVSEEELHSRHVGAAHDAVAALTESRRAVFLPFEGERRLVPFSYVGRYCSTLGIPFPPGLGDAPRDATTDSFADLVLRFARSRPPFTLPQLCERYSLPTASTTLKLGVLVGENRLLTGAFTPLRTCQEWVAPEVLQRIRRRAIARLRQAVEAAPKEAFARALPHWQGLLSKRAGLDAILDAVEQLQGCPLYASTLEDSILPARVAQFSPADLDALATSGEIIWVGLEAIGAHDGVIALFLADDFTRLHRPRIQQEAPTDDEARVLECLRQRGALFTSALATALRPLFGANLERALWSLVFKGLITNDSFQVLRRHLGVKAKTAQERFLRRSFRSRRAQPMSSDGRWVLVEHQLQHPPTPTERSHAVAQSLLNRYGLVTRAVADAESLAGGFSALYDVYRTLEERGTIRRGYFVADVAAMQFADNAAVELLRTMNKPPPEDEVLWLAASDPANAYGALLPWPDNVSNKRPSRASGTRVLLANGRVLAWLSKSEKSLLTFFEEDDPAVETHQRHLTAALEALAQSRLVRRQGWMLEDIDGVDSAQHRLATTFRKSGFEVSSEGIHMRRKSVKSFILPTPSAEPVTENESLDDEIAQEMREAGLDDELE